MRLTSFTDFGLRILMRLAGAPGRSFTTDEIARELAISRHHLTKVVGELSRAGFVETRRGGGGGISLARPASEIRLGTVVRQLEARHAMVECFKADGGACRMRAGCRLRGRLAAAEGAFLSELDRSTLADCAWAP